jgi:hypothetical protein
LPNDNWVPSRENELNSVTQEIGVAVAIVPGPSATITSSYLFIIFSVLGFELRALHLLGMYFTT